MGWQPALPLILGAWHETPAVMKMTRLTEHIEWAEQYGVLEQIDRIHVNDADDNIRQRIETAKEESIRTCEICGQPGIRREGGWIKTLCDQHATAAAAQSSVENQVK